MRIGIFVITLFLFGSPVQAQTSAASASSCFQVIEGNADVPPAAPILLDRCTGETFVLTRLRRGGGIAAPFEWVPLTKGRAAETETSSSTPTVKSPAAGKAGCFTYNGRSYCP